MPKQHPTERPQGLYPLSPDRPRLGPAFPCNMFHICNIVKHNILRYRRAPRTAALFCHGTSVALAWQQVRHIEQSFVTFGRFHMRIQTFYDPATYTLTYVVFDPDSHDAIVIDPVLDYDPLASQTSLASIEKVSAFVQAEGLSLRHVLETHAHADHLTGAQYLKRRFGAQVVIGQRITEVQQTFKHIFSLADDFPVDGSQFDRLLADGQVLTSGRLQIEAIGTPGHTPACLTYKVGDALFTGDALFMEDYGTGRCDFPAGSAADLYESIHDKLYLQPDSTRVFVGHDYQPNGRSLRYETTIGISKASNIHITAHTTKEQFVAFRQTRDKTLTQPRLLFPSVQVNVDAGRLPAPQKNGIRYLQIPLNLKRPTADDGVPLSLMKD